MTARQTSLPAAASAAATAECPSGRSRAKLVGCLCRFLPCLLSATNANPANSRVATDNPTTAAATNDFENANRPSTSSSPATPCSSPVSNIPFCPASASSAPPLPSSSLSSSLSSEETSSVEESRRRHQQPDSFPELLRWALLQVSVDTMAITALPLDCWLKERLKSWVQLSGHQGTIVPASNLSLWKKLPQNNRAEAMAYVEIMRDPALRGVTPKFYREIVHRNEAFIEIQDLLAEFPNVECRALMDIKLGTRTFLQCEVANQHKRPDLYRKMVEVAPEEPTEEERRDEAITKMRYMQFRERRSTSASLGFRIEAAQMPCGPLQKDFKRLATSKQVRQALMEFFGANRELIRRQLLARLKQIRTAVANSRFLRTHEVVGSSLLLVHDGCRAGAWLIDFAKSHPWDQQPANTQIPELRNNGYVTGLDSLVNILEPAAEVEQLPSSGTTPVEHHGDNMAPGRQMRCREEA